MLKIRSIEFIFILGDYCRLRYICEMLQLNNLDCCYQQGKGLKKFKIPNSLLFIQLYIFQLTQFLVEHIYQIRQKYIYFLQCGFFLVLQLPLNARPLMLDSLAIYFVATQPYVSFQNLALNIEEKLGECHATFEENNSAFHLPSLRFEYVNYRKRTNFYQKHLHETNNKCNITSRHILYSSK